jgi:hypothetical protein
MSSRIRRDSKANADIWHLRFGHIKQHALQQVQDRVEGIVVTGDHKLSCTYEVCIQAAAKRQTSRIPIERPQHQGDEISVDTVVISRSIEGFCGETCFMLITDRATLERTAYPLETKGTAKMRLMEHLNLVKMQTGREAKTLRIDNGTEFGGKQLFAECVRRGIVVKFTTPHNSSQNGRAEVSNNVVVVMARKLILAGQLLRTIWLEAVVAACYLLNRLLSRRLSGKSPLEIKHGRKPYVGHLRVYSYKAYVLRYNIVRSDKFADRIIAGRPIGYEGDNIHRVWIPEQRKIKCSSHMLFDEHAFDIATRDEEETFHPADFGLLDPGGACAPAKGVTVTKSPMPRTHGATESPGSSTGVETPPTEDEPDIEHEDLESRTPNVGRTTFDIELAHRSGRKSYPSQKVRDREDLES